MTSIDSSTGAYVSVDGLEVTLGDGVLSLTLNRPDSLNSLTATMLNGIADALDQAATDPQVKVVRLAGAGRGFSSGAGISADDQAKKAGGLVRAGRRQPSDPIDRGAAPPGGLGRAGSRRGRRRIAGVGLRRRTRLGQGLFHARLHQDRPDARRRRFGSGRGRRRAGSARCGWRCWPTRSTPTRHSRRAW